MSSYTINFKSSAAKELKKLPIELQHRVSKAIAKLIKDDRNQMKFHGIMVITDKPRMETDKPRRGGSRTAPTTNEQYNADTINKKRKPLGRLIGAFKTVSTKKINILRNAPKTPLWQRNAP